MQASARRSSSLILALLCCGYFLVLLDVTIVNVALPDISHTLAAGVSTLQWVVNGYALPLAALLLSAGTVGDLFGHKRIVVIGLALFGVSSLACGLAPSATLLVAARAVQGIGAATLLPGTLALIARTSPEPSEQARAIGIWVGVGSIALPAGPLVGGLLVQTLGWRAVFLLNVPIVGVAAVAAARLLPTDTGRVFGRRLDPAGTLLAAVGLAALAFAVIEAGREGFRPVVSVAAIVAVLAIAGFIRAERTARDPMLPLALLRQPAFMVANLVSASMNFGNLGLLFLLTPFLQIVQSRGPLVAGAALLPLFLPLALLAPLAGRAVSRWGSRPMMITGLVITAAGTSLLAGISPNSSYLWLLPALILWGAGQGILTPSAVAAAVAAVPAGRSGLASGVNNSARQAGGVLGIAVFGAIAGQAHPGSAPFVVALGRCGLLAAVIWLLGAALTAVFVRPKTIAKT